MSVVRRQFCGMNPAASPASGALSRICGKGQVVLCEDESYGPARVTSDDGIVCANAEWIGTWGLAGLLNIQSARFINIYVCLCMCDLTSAMSDYQIRVWI